MLAASAAFVARRMHTLSTTGALAAAVVGTISIAAGWSWGALLFAMFISSTALSKLGEERKAERVGAIVDKGGERDASQVLANGGVFAVAALGSLLDQSPIWYAIGAGALAAAAADTWSTEVGTLLGGNPISIISGKRVPPGSSGGISLVGTAAGLGGALFVGTAAMLAGWPVPLLAVAVGGVGGALVDSLLGATIQSRRWCDVCKKPTERLVHDCGTPTRQVGGLVGFDNDAVNAVCSSVGALIAFLLSR